MYSLVIRWLVAVLQAIIFGNGYIALCAVVMCQTTAWLFHRQLPGLFLLFIFSGILSSYCLHEYLSTIPSASTERERWIDTHKPVLLGLFLAAGVIGNCLLTQLTAYLTDLVPVILLTFLYTAPKINWRPFLALRQIAVLKTTYLSLVWTYVTVVLPILLTTQIGQASWLVVSVWMLNRFLLIYSIALCFDYRDRNEDRQSNWLTIVSMITEKQIRFFFGLIIGCFGLTVVTLYWQGWDQWTLLCVGMPMILLLIIGRRIVRSSSDYGYYVYLDSLLMVSGILLSLVGQFR